MDYEGDPVKAERNILKHGVSFETADGFDWNQAVIMEDSRRDYGEPRFIAVGPIGPRLHVLVFTPRGTKIRIGGLRKANKREKLEREKLRYERP